MQEEMEAAAKKAAEAEQQQQTTESDGFFDVKKMLKLQETELKYNDLLFELEQLRTDNLQLKGTVNKEQKLSKLLTQLYNKLKGRHFAEASVQTDNVDNYFLFSQILKAILDEEPRLRENILTQKKFMDLFWKFFEFQEEVKREIADLPRLRKYQQHQGPTEQERAEHENLAKIDFYESNRLPARENASQLLEADSADDIVVAQRTTKAKRATTEFVDHGIRKDLKASMQGPDNGLVSQPMDQQIDSGTSPGHVPDSTTEVMPFQPIEDAEPASPAKLIKPQAHRIMMSTPSSMKQKII